ncbi:PaaI family thioesterase [Ectopseudomonas hydrolytica]|uniref:PaaI family thioesterase n=1 Tax=Ectopseudomonas hydrolytica TaxID=2493633 RepID=UPI0010FC1343|nr:PaaI family thioesterase [Pseudomonas hydrolytica]ARS50326.1 thioesterase [Pseudomonas mendocina]MBF8163816.1 PaaI family thioesterase [Pseudomonas mendocina]UTH32802.1 PaaI family thioesterase [Pseudomonas hydrolytica]UZZ11976.1 PaaI family thioesterase [Pseudomonas mendocina]
MNEHNRDTRLAAWIAEEQAARDRLAAPGTLALAEVAGMAPLDFFDAIGRGELPSPPFGQLLDFVPLQWSRGRFVFQGTPDGRHYNPLGSVHGGYIATLLDSCMGCAVHTLLKPGQGYTTADLRVSYIRALRSEAGPVRAEGHIIHVGRSTALAEGRLYDVDDRLYAVASTTCLILDMNGTRQNREVGVR